MPLVTGQLTDVTGTTMAGYFPRIKFELSGIGLGGASLYATQPIYVTPAPDGTFSVNIVGTQQLDDDVYYNVSVEWLDAAGNFIRVDHVPHRLRLPPLTGGTIGDLLITYLRSDETWYNPGAVIPIPEAQPGDLIFDTLTGFLSVLE